MKSADLCNKASLEYVHAVVLDADALGAKDLCVAMTRASKSVTIIGTNRPSKVAVSNEIKSFIGN